MNTWPLVCLDLQLQRPQPRLLSQSGARMGSADEDCRTCVALVFLPRSRLLLSCFVGHPLCCVITAVPHLVFSHMHALLALPILHAPQSTTPPLICTLAGTSIDTVSAARLSAPSAPAAGAAANGSTHTAVSMDAPSLPHALSLPGAVELTPGAPPKVPANSASHGVGEAPAGFPGTVAAGLGSAAGRSSVGSQAGAAAAPPRPPLEAQERLQLLQGITGYAEPGVLTALMGGSGAGKVRIGDVNYNEQQRPPEGAPPVFSSRMLWHPPC